MMSDYKAVLAIDPGGTSGMAVRFPNGLLSTFTCSTPEEVYAFIDNTKDVLQQVVVENFQAELIGKWGLFTVRIVGGVYALCYIYNINYKLHMPQDRYPFLKEAKEHLDAIKKEKKIRYVVHEKDALAHLFRLEYDNDT
jgi:hypothetical protein